MKNINATKKCKYCQSEIPAYVKACPKCFRQQQTIPIWVIVAIIIVVILAIIGIVSGGGNEGSDNTNTNNNSSKTQETVEYIKVSKDELDDALEENAAAAKDTYIDKYVEITGKLGTINSDLKYISLRSTTNSWDFNGVHCSIKNDEQREIVKTLTKEQTLTIRGKITAVGEVLGYYLDITEIITP